KVCLEADVFRFCSGPDYIDRGVDDLRRINIVPIQPQFARDDAGYIEEIIDELALRTSLSLDSLKRTQLRSVGHLTFQRQLRPAADCSQRSPELGRNDGEEFVFHPIRTFRLLTRGLLANKQLVSFRLGLLALDGKSNCAVDRLDHPLLGGARSPWPAV